MSKPHTRNRPTIKAGRFFMPEKLRTMAYTTGMMNKRVKVAKRAADAASGYGKGAGGERYTNLGEFWAAED